MSAIKLTDDDVLYHAQISADSSQQYRGSCPKWRLLAQLDCRSELRSMAFPDPGAFMRRNLSANVSKPASWIAPEEVWAFNCVSEVYSGEVLIP